MSEHLDGCWEYDKENVGSHFHKGFRQADIIEKVYLRKLNSEKKGFYERHEDLSMDTVVWKLLQNAPKFWEVLNRFEPKKKK